MVHVLAQGLGNHIKQGFLVSVPLDLERVDPGESRASPCLSLYSPTSPLTILALRSHTHVYRRKRNAVMPLNIKNTEAEKSTCGRW
eukprot:scaffold2315_cov113-Cylindrotheca_fusiformis.AAC.9